MSEAGGRSSEATGARTAGAAAAGRVAFLDQALWRQFNEATTPEAFAKAWLALQCRLIPDVGRGVVVLGEPDGGPFKPVGAWPDDNARSPALAAAAEAAMTERRGVVRVRNRGAQTAAAECSQIAYPFLIDDRLHGVVAVETDVHDQGALRDVMRQLQWGASWIELRLRREQAHEGQHQLDRTAAAFDLVAVALEETRFKAACKGVVTELAMRLNCDQVSVGFTRRNRTIVAALSHSAQFGRRMNLIRGLGAAMDEAVDQESIILYPPDPDGGYRITQAHGEIARALDAGSMLTIPLYSRGAFVGALTLQRPHGDPFEQETVDLCDAVAALLGPILDEKRRNDRLVLLKLWDSALTQLKRLVGPDYVGRKLAAAATALAVLFFAFAKDDYRVSSPAAIEGLVQRVVVAPFDGYVAAQSARAGETVRKGQVLATLDEKDLVLERLRWASTRRQRLTEYDRALATRSRAEIAIVKAQIEQADSQIALLDVQIARTRMVAAFDGLVVSGDLSQSVGAAVKRGDELFRITPLDSYRVILEVDEGDIADVRIGQTGRLVVSSLLDDRFPYTIDTITPVSEAREGRNFFRVEARLRGATDRLRPGMEGVAKTDVDDRRLIWIWTHDLVDWLRLTVWKWWP